MNNNYESFFYDVNILLATRRKLTPGSKFHKSSQVFYDTGVIFLCRNVTPGHLSMVVTIRRYT